MLDDAPIATSSLTLYILLEQLLSRLLRAEDYRISNELNGADYLIGGVAIVNSDSILDTLQQLAQIYDFEVINVNGVINCVPTTRESVGVIEDKDIIRATEEKTIYEEINIPQKLNLKYYSIGGELTADVQTSTLARASFGTEQNGDTPFLISHQTAKNASMSQHRRIIEEAKGTIDVELPPKYRDFKVGDYVSYDDEVLKISKVEYKNTSQKLTLKYIRAYGANADVSYKASIPPPPPPIAYTNTSLTVVSLMDTHILDDADDELVLYLAVQGLSTVWNGCSIDLSLDGGVHWENDVYRTASQGVMGVLKSDLEIADRWYPDTLNSVDVELLDEQDEIDGFTNAQQLNRYGMLFIDGELLSYGEVDYIDAGRLHLSHLFRGRRGSTIKKHLAGSTVVFLDIGAVVPLPMEVNYLNRNLTLRVNTFGRDDSYTINLTYKGNSQRERKPARLRATNLGDGTLKIEWVGVGRIGGGANAKMSKYFEGYIVDVDGVKTNISNNSIIVDDDVQVVKVAQRNYYTGAGEWAELVL